MTWGDEDSSRFASAFVVFSNLAFLILAGRRRAPVVVEDVLVSALARHWLVGRNSRRARLRHFSTSRCRPADEGASRLRCGVAARRSGPAAGKASGGRLERMRDPAG